MLQSYLQNGGSEPKVVGTAFALAKGAASEPIIGTTGVYIIKPISDVTKTPLPADLTMFRRQVTSSSMSNVAMGMMPEMKKRAKIEDNRSRFF
ncbi:MAG: hypothetical protein R2792_08655 [Saprospiraceae bacterium]